MIFKDRAKKIREYWTEKTGKPSGGLIVAADVHPVSVFTGEGKTEYFVSSPDKNIF